MGNILHANAKTTPRIRKEIQESKESVIKIAKKYNINPKTVQKWRHRDSVSDRSSRNIKLRSSLSEMDQQIICEAQKGFFLLKPELEPTQR